MKNKHCFMARQARKGKRIPPGKSRPKKLDRLAFRWRRSLGLTIEGFNEYLLSLDE